MLDPRDFLRLRDALRDHGRESAAVKEIVSVIRLQLNPHPAGQLHNIPMLNERLMEGMQHKYEQTVLFFPSQGQTCHSFCTFCFRWPQFVRDDIKFAASSPAGLIAYLSVHPEVRNVLFTGGDPLVMRTTNLASYIDPLVSADLPNLTEIRIGTKAMSYWPYRFLDDPDSDDLLRLFERVVKSGRHIAIMAHVNHWREMTEPFVRALKRIQETGAVVRTQSPIMRHVNDNADDWAIMWSRQVALGMVPYYMFMPRDTGAQQYFSVPLAKAHAIFREAYKGQSGLGRTVRGPVMSTDPGKVEVMGVTEVVGEKVFVLRLLQARNPDIVLQPFFAKFDDKAIWLDDLRPALAERFIFE